MISSIVDDCKQLASQIPQVQFSHCFMEVVRTIFEFLAQIMNGLRPKKPKTINL